MKKQFIVIGLGRFGMSLSRTLIQNNHEVLAVDQDMHLVEIMSDVATQAFQGDCTDESVLEELGVRNFSHAVVAVGENLQASILITLLLKDLGVPKVTAKARDSTHGKMLKKMGVDQIVYPERDMGIRLGKQLSSENLIDYIELSPDFNLVEIKAPSGMHKLTLQQLNARETYGCNIIAIKQNEHINMSPKANDIIHSGDTLLIMGHNTEIRRLENRYE